MRGGSIATLAVSAAALAFVIIRPPVQPVVEAGPFTRAALPHPRSENPVPLGKIVLRPARTVHPAAHSDAVELVAVEREGPALSIAAYADCGGTWLITFRRDDGKFRHAFVGQAVPETDYKLLSFRLDSATSSEPVPRAVLEESSGAEWIVGGNGSAPHDLSCVVRGPDGSLTHLRPGGQIRSGPLTWTLLNLDIASRSAVLTSDAGARVTLQPGDFLPATPAPDSPLSAIP